MSTISFNFDNSPVIFISQWKELELRDTSAASLSYGQDQSHKLFRSQACGIFPINFFFLIPFQNICAKFCSIFFNHFNISRFHFRVTLTYLSSPRLPLETDEICFALSSTAFWRHFSIFISSVVFRFLDK